MIEVASKYMQRNRTSHEFKQVLWVGVGCTKASSQKLIEKAVEQVFRENQLAESAIAGIATIDVKSDQAGLVEFCHQRHFPLKTFPCDVLRQVAVPNPSNIVAKEVGTSSVAEAAALCAASDLTSGQYPDVEDTTQGLRAKLLVAKQIFRLEEELGVVTVAVAQVYVSR